MDREFIGRQQLVGKWKLTSISFSLQATWLNWDQNWTLEFHEDGTFDLVTIEEEFGEIVFSEFYEGEHMDFYVFDGYAGDRYYNFNYEPVEDVVIIAGRYYFKFTRIVE